jgi:ABC-type transport system involved in multi-copper enzyme maturation permease subunit
MRWLLWKDYRQNRLLVFTALFLLLAPHVIAICAAVRYKLLDDPVASHGLEFLASSSLFSVALSQVAAALIGGNLIAGERVDRSAEFLFSLPYTRRRLLASKLLLAIAVMAPGWVVNALVACSVWWLGGISASKFAPSVAEMLGWVALGGLVFFCVAWLLSSLCRSTAVASVGGMMIPLFVPLGISLVDYQFGLRLHDTSILV